MLCVTKYDPVKDVMEVDPTGYVDLRLANVMNTIDGASGGVDPVYDSTESFDPKSVSFMPKDAFEAMQARRAVWDYLQKEAKSNINKETS